MINFVSTIQQPLKFFEDLLLEGGYEEFRNEFYELWEKNDPIGALVRFYKEEDYIVHDFQILFDEAEFETPRENIHDKLHPRVKLKLFDEVSISENINDWKDRTFPPQKGIKKRVNLKDVLELRINKEYIISQQLISKAVSEITFNNNSPDIFLNQQLLISKRLCEKDIWLFKEYPNCKNQLESLSQYILQLVSKDFVEMSSDINPINNDPIEGILSYLKGKNEHGFQIMSEKEYDRLLEAIRYIITNKEIPKVLTKFRIKVPVGVLRYTFYLLLPLFEDYKESFMQFIHDSIYEFEGGSFSYFKTKISVPPTTIPSYLPPIFREKKQQQMNKYK